MHLSHQPQHLHHTPHYRKSCSTSSSSSLVPAAPNLLTCKRYSKCRAQPRHIQPRRSWDECTKAKANGHHCADATPAKGLNGEVLVQKYIAQILEVALDILRGSKRVKFLEPFARSLRLSLNISYFSVLLKLMPRVHTFIHQLPIIFEGRNCCPEIRMVVIMSRSLSPESAALVTLLEAQSRSAGSLGSCHEFILSMLVSESHIHPILFRELSATNPIRSVGRKPIQ
jgi:hypothetical protein